MTSIKNYLSVSWCTNLIDAWFSSTQVDDSDHRVPQDASGKMRESHRILQESTGNRWNMEVVFRPEIFRTFSGEFLPTSCALRKELGGKNPKNFRPEYCFHKINAITLNRSFPGRTVRPRHYLINYLQYHFLIIIIFNNCFTMRTF